MNVKTTSLFTLLAAFAAAPALAGEHQSPREKDGDAYECPHKKRMHGDHQAWFSDADADGDGNISWDEFKANHEDMLKQKFEKLDADGDGKVTKEELAAYKAKKAEMMEKKHEHKGEKGEKKGEKKGKKDK